jgi:Excalibur calcium-binding domain
VKRSICGAAIIVLLAMAPQTTATAAKAPAVPKFKTCDALNAVYPNGVGRTGAVDKTKQEPVTTFTVDNAVYKANTARDRDKDGIACELL